MELLKKRCNQFINFNSDFICLKFYFTEILDCIQCVGTILCIRLHLSCELAASLLVTIRLVMILVHITDLNWYKVLYKLKILGVGHFKNGKCHTIFDCILWKIKSSYKKQKGTLSGTLVIHVSFSYSFKGEGKPILTYSELRLLL